jgi:acyl-CoA thioester hydrolase
VVNAYQQLIQVQSHHLDELAHVNNIVYLQWAEQIAWQHSEQLGLSIKDFRLHDAAMVARQHELNYLAGCFLGDEIQLKTWLSANDGLSLYRQYEFIRLSDQKIVFKGQTRWVCVRLSTGRPIRMPEAFRKAYQVD